MIINCQSCSRKFIVKDKDIPRTGRMVQCGYCSAKWHQMPAAPAIKVTEVKTKNKAKAEKAISNDLSVDAIKASDGKTYKFLGSQWAQLLPSGKTGIFAKKKIGRELDKLTGREIENTSEKRKKKNKKEMDPSLAGLSDEKKLSDVYKSQSGVGFFGYIFLLIIVGFSTVGILKTFESDLVNSYPETEYIYQLLDEQLQYVSESIKNMITIIQDLIDSY